MHKRATSRPRVFSYSRFSTPDQAKGDSERRQIEQAQAWAQRNGHVLDESHGLIDRGKSAYSGAHRLKGALGRFLKLVEDGEIPAGSILLVENVDRLSREGAFSALRDVIGRLWDHGVILQTLNPEESYPPGCDSDPRFLALFLYLQRAQDESKRKSERIRAARIRARESAREHGRILTGMCPAWLTIEKGKFQPISEAVKTINQIFELKAEGIGVRSIVAKLNAGATWTPPAKRIADRERGLPGNGWRTSYVNKILANRAVIGEYQPHQRIRQADGKATRGPIGEAIPNYFPPIVAPPLFHAVARILSENKGKGGRADKNANVLKWLCKCSYCGASMTYVDKGRTSKGGQYLVCERGRRGAGCSRRSIKYGECETLILDHCHRLRPEMVLPNPDEQSRHCQALKKRISGLDGKLLDVERRIENFIDQIGETKNRDLRERYETRVQEHQSQKSQIETELDSARAELREAERGEKDFAKWKRDLSALKDALAQGSPDLRAKLNFHLRELIEVVEVFSDGFETDSPEKAKPSPIHVTSWEKRKERTSAPGKVRVRLDDPPRFDDIAETLEAHLSEYDKGWKPDREFLEFSKWLVSRRLSREGRFLRVWFRSGAVVDLAPPNGLAGLFAATRKTDSPDLAELLAKFRKERKAKT